MDIRMPDISGYDLLPLIKNKIGKTGKHVPLIALTAQVLPEETESILQYGFDEVLHKPFRESDLLGVLCINISSSENSGIAGDVEMVNLFKEETTNDLAAIQELVAQNQSDGIAFYFHKIASRLGQMEYTALGKEARGLEIAIRKGDYREAAVTDLCMRIQDIL